MDLFLSWSGDLSKNIAEELKKWIPSVLQSVQPYFTPSDIEKGSRWLPDISKKLEECLVGIFCITPENLNSPWILFEAGALSKKVDSSYVCPIIFNLEKSDLTGPLAAFQATEFNKEDFFALTKTINSSCTSDRCLDDATLKNVFEKWWPDLEEKIHLTLQGNKTPKGKFPLRSEKELIQEVLEITRSLHHRIDSMETGGGQSGTRPLPMASKDISSAFLSLHTAIREREEWNNLLNILKDMRPAVGWLVREFLKDTDLTRKVRSLDFDPIEDLPF